MSDTAREKDAMLMARRTAQHSVTLLKRAAGFRPGEEQALAMPSAPQGAGRLEVITLTQSTEVKGSIVTPDEVQIDGKIEGDVRAAKVTVGATGVVKGDVKGETVVIHGAVEGRVEGQHVRLWAGACVKGEIAHGSLGIDTQADFEGAVKRLEALAVAAE